MVVQISIISLENYIIKKNLSFVIYTWYRQDIK